MVGVAAFGSGLSVASAVSLVSATLRGSCCWEAKSQEVGFFVVPHQKGIIHRDLKPSNVLVAVYDGKPVPKVIDFGVAKATGQQLTDRTMFAGFGDVIGTLEYMAPEQAEVNQLDVDTRSDIYSLG